MDAAPPAAFASPDGNRRHHTQVMAWFGWKTASEAERYAPGADHKRAAATAGRLVSGTGIGKPEIQFAKTARAIEITKGQSVSGDPSRSTTQRHCKWLDRQTGLSTFIEPKGLFPASANRLMPSGNPGQPANARSRSSAPCAVPAECFLGGAW
jgi:hypothetical protein